MTAFYITIAIIVAPLLIYAFGYFFAKGQMRGKSEYLKYELKGLFQKGENHDRSSSRLGRK